MKRYSKVLFLLISFLLVTAGFAFADSLKDENAMAHTYAYAGSEIGPEIVASAKALAAAKKYNYDRTGSDSYAYAGSEIGPEIVAAPKAQLAAKLYSYDQPEAFATVSDEAGTSYFAAEHQSADVHEAIANLDKERTICLTC